jgi:hypothetical protein
MDHSSTSNAIAVLDAAPSASSAVVKNDNAQHTHTRTIQRSLWCECCSHNVERAGQLCEKKMIEWSAPVFSGGSTAKP